MDINHIQKVREAQQIQRGLRKPQVGQVPGDRTGSFREVLHETAQRTESGVKLSVHAQERIQQRNIPMTPQDMENITQAISQAEARGSKSSLILMQDKGFIVSVPNKTVITAIDQVQLRENVFTNIDSTVII